MPRPAAAGDKKEGRRQRRLSRLRQRQQEWSPSCESETCVPRMPLVAPSRNDDQFTTSAAEQVPVLSQDDGGVVQRFWAGTPPNIRPNKGIGS